MTNDRRIDLELSEDKLKAVAGGWPGAWMAPASDAEDKKQADAIKGFQQMLQELP